jgi:DNA-binding transcriptional regulator YhcF (GntR family)
MNIKITDSSAGPIYGQVRDQIQSLIRAGELRGGEQLPAPAALAVDLNVDRGEITRAYYELEIAGLLVKESGSDFLGKPRTTYRVA